VGDRGIERVEAAGIGAEGGQDEPVAVGEEAAPSETSAAHRERGEIERLTQRTRFVWIAGNHDPAPPPAGWGEVAEEIDESPLIFRHEAQFGPVKGEVSGHYHPVAALTVRGRGFRRRCFLTDGHRLILPAFGAYAGGLNALDPAIAQLFPSDYDALVVGRDAVRRLSWRQLRPDPSLASTAWVREVR